MIHFGLQEEQEWLKERGKKGLMRKLLRKMYIESRWCEQGLEGSKLR